MSNSNNHKFFRTTESRGFTLVETLVAITILIMAVMGPMTIAARGMQMGFYANQQTTAVSLAQESIESIQKLRDDNALEAFVDTANNGTEDTWSWYSASNISSCKNGSCDYDPTTSGNYRNCTLGCRLYLETVTNKYGYGAGAQSPFTRTIQIGAVSGGGVPVTVTVSWSTPLFSTTRSVVLRTWVYDHYEFFETN